MKRGKGFRQSLVVCRRRGCALLAGDRCIGPAELSCAYDREIAEVATARARDEMLERWALNDKMITLRLSQQGVIELGYAVKMLVEPLAESHGKLSFEVANCLKSVFYKVRGFLKKVDPAYLGQPQHQQLADFYSEPRELDNSWDRLSWTPDKDGLKEYQEGEPF